MPGMGAVATTLVAGVELIKKRLAEPVGSLSQMGTVRLGKRTEDRSPKINELVPLSSLDNLVFGGWDPFPDNAYEAAVTAGVLSKEHLGAVVDELRAVEPLPAVFDPRYVSRIDASHVKSGASTFMEAAEMVREDIRSFKSANDLDRVVMVSCASTEAYAQPREAHYSVEAFEAALENSDPAISPAMIYAYAAIQEGVPYANGAPSLAVDIPALIPTRRRPGRARSRKGLQDRPDPDEDHPGAGIESSDARSRRLVLDQHPRQPRRRSARRRREPQEQGGQQALRPRTRSYSRTSTRNSTRKSTTS